MIYPLNQPLTELLLLSTISKNDSYGYIISQNLKKVSNLKDSALYPMLKRLSDQNYVEIYDQLYQGRNRKYYRITDVGNQYRQNLLNEWDAYCHEIGIIVHPEVKSSSGENNEMSDCNKKNETTATNDNEKVIKESENVSGVIVEGGEQDDER